MNRRVIWLLLSAALLVLGVGAASWMAGAPEEIHRITQPVAVPEHAQ